VDPIQIRYRFRLDERPEEVVELALDRETLALVGAGAEAAPEWTALGFAQCRNCPLVESEHPRCPLALALVRIVGLFRDVVSHDELLLEVETEERKVQVRTTAQRALSSLMGVVMAASGCPHTAWFRPMARFHLPLASHEETVFRAAGMYLLAQYFRHRDGFEADLDLAGLKAIYEELAVVNEGIVERLRAAIEKDSAANAVVLLDVHARMLPFAIEESMDELRPLFRDTYLRPEPDAD
jgi:hypothetical protein